MKLEDPYILSPADFAIEVITLKREDIRPNLTVTSLLEQGVQFHEFHAFDGLTDLSSALIAKYAGPRKSKYLAAGPVGPKAVELHSAYRAGLRINNRLRAALHEKLRFGCYMSHVLLWERLVDSGYPFMVVLEDDVIIESSFIARLRLRMSNLPASWGLLYLNGCFKKVGPVFNVGLRQSKGGLCTYGYVISSETAAKLISGPALASDKAIDHMLDEQVLTGRVTAFHSDPPLVHPLGLESTLAYRN